MHQETPFMRAEADRAFAVLKAGGVAVMPMDVGYSAIGGSYEALQRVFNAKRRQPTKFNAMIGDNVLARELYVLPDEGWAAFEAITIDDDLPLGVIGPCRMDHPILAAMESAALNMSTKDGTLCMLTNAGPFHAAISRQSREAGHALFGSSANLSMAGTKFRAVEIEPEIRNVADIIIDHGLRKCWPYRASSTLLDLSTFEVVRYGSSYELIQDTMRRRFGIELPESPFPLKIVE
ncbi:MAG: L-threonylcarbamoyladenylate synthase [Alphaproteobacteria bacterium]